MADLKLLKFPRANVQDIPAMLRKLADDIESERLGPVCKIAYVMDMTDGNVEVGLAGESASPGAEAFLLLACGQKHILGGIS